MGTKSMQIAIPEGVAFTDLKLTRDPVSGEVVFDWTPIEIICEYNKIDITVFKHQHEDNVSGLMVTWYTAHLRSGGARDETADQLIAEAEAENQFGEVNVISGAPKQ